MIKIIKQELNISPCLKKKITWASKYTNVDIKKSPIKPDYLKTKLTKIKKNYEFISEIDL